MRYRRYTYYIHHTESHDGWKDVDTFTRSSTYNRLGQILRPHFLHNPSAVRNEDVKVAKSRSGSVKRKRYIYAYIDESHAINFKLLNFPIAFKLPFRIRKLPINCWYFFWVKREMLTDSQFFFFFCPLLINRQTMCLAGDTFYERINETVKGLLPHYSGKSRPSLHLECVASTAISWVHIQREYLCSAVSIAMTVKNETWSKLRTLQTPSTQTVRLA